MFAGVAVSWITTINSFVNFYRIEGTLFKIKDCAVPNPIVTPCFWGALAFIAGAYWAIKLNKEADAGKEKGFLYFIIFCILFAWSNFLVEVLKIDYKIGGVISPCPVAYSSPWVSACFFGSVLFTLSGLTTLLIVKSKKH